jgi:hypothetical protein
VVLVVHLHATALNSNKAHESWAILAVLNMYTWYVQEQYYESVDGVQTLECQSAEDVEGLRTLAAPPAAFVRHRGWLVSALPDRVVQHLLCRANGSTCLFD